MFSWIIELVFNSFVSFIFSYGLAVFCHEAGHALVGKIYKGNFLMLRVGRLVWVQGSLRCFIIRGNFLSPGQCILLCNSRKGCCYAALGGCAMNVAAAAAMFMAVCLKIALGRGSFLEFMYSGNFFFPFFIIFCFSFFIISVLMVIINWFPIPFLHGEENDGKLWGLIKNDCQKCDEFMKEQRKFQFLLEEGQLSELLG